jgi:hypothetical protein
MVIYAVPMLGVVLSSYASRDQPKAHELIYHHLLPSPAPRTFQGLRADREQRTPPSPFKGSLVTLMGSSVSPRSVVVTVE